MIYRCITSISLRHRRSACLTGASSGTHYFTFCTRNQQESQPRTTRQEIERPIEDDVDDDGNFGECQVINDVADLRLACLSLGANEFIVLRKEEHNEAFLLWMRVIYPNILRVNTYLSTRGASNLYNSYSVELSSNTHVKLVGVARATVCYLS